MRKLMWCSLSLCLLAAVAFIVGCGKKPVGLPAAEIPPDGVTNVPPPAERDPDMTVPDPALVLAGAIKEVKVKILDKAADDNTKALLHIKPLALDGPVDVSDNTRWEVWKPGSDPEEQKPEADGWTSAESPVPAGTWDIRLRYEDGDLVKVSGWIRNVTFTAGKLWKAEAVLAAPMQFVRIFGTIKGDDVVDNMHIDLFKGGTDKEEFKPLASFWSTQKIPIPAGTYDLGLSYDKDQIKAKGNVKGFTVGSDHGIFKTTVKMTKE